MSAPTKASLFALLIVGCSSPPEPAPDSAQAAISLDSSLYENYEWPAHWLTAKNESGEEVHGAYVAKSEGDRQIVVADSASALLGHEGKLSQTVLAFASHCGRNTADAVNNARPLGVIGHDAGIGLHAGGIQCIGSADELDIPAATVSANTAYVGAGMSVWTTGKLSVVNKTAEALGVRVGMGVQEAAQIMLAKAKTPPSATAPEPSNE